MPSNTKFDPFRHFRRRSIAVPSPLSEVDSDRSSPERDRPHPIHVRDSGDLISGDPKPSRDKSTAHSSSRPPHPERLSSKAFKSGVACVAYPNDAVDTLQPTAKPTLIRRVTSKLSIYIPSRSDGELRSRASTRTLHRDPASPRLPKQSIAPPLHPNSFVSKQHREAALRERGLLPPRKDFSEQERDADQRLGCAPSLSAPFGKSTEAEQLKQSWLALNKISQGSDAEPEPHTSQPEGTKSPFPTPLPRSTEDLPPAGRDSCGSVPPLSPSSCLEVLHEESSDRGPITPPPPLLQTPIPIVVSSAADSLPSPTLVESPVSPTFSSCYPGSTLESMSQFSCPSVPEKDFVRSRAHRRRTIDSSDRKSKLSHMGSRSFLNLRRAVVGSLWVPSSSTLSTSDRSSSYSPRVAIDPTMHSLGSIVRETREIEDPESRQLSELAFLN